MCFIVSGSRHCSALQDELDACKAECMDVESRQQNLDTHLSSNLRRRQQELQEVLLGADAEAERWVMSGMHVAWSHKAVPASPAWEEGRRLLCCGAYAYPRQFEWCC